MNNSKSCSCFHHSMTPIWLMLLALSILLGNAGIIAESTASLLWPTFLGLIGLQKLLSNRCKCCSNCCTPGSDSTGCCGPKS